jgi:hypothetical protein
MPGFFCAFQTSAIISGHSGSTASTRRHQKGVCAAFSQYTEPLALTRAIQELPGLFVQHL